MHRHNQSRFAVLATLLILAASVSVAVAPGVPISAQTEEELRRQIEQHNEQIRQLEQEIAQYQEELTGISRERQTLQGAVRQLDISRNQIAARVNRAQTQIQATQLEITQVQREIDRTELSIDRGLDGLGEAIRRLDEAESKTMVEAFLSARSVQGLWEEIDVIQQFQFVMRERIQELHAAKETLEEAQREAEAKREELLEQRNDLAAQQRALDINRQEKNALLSETREQESEYQRILSEKREAKEKFEQELQQFEAQLSYTSDPSQIPSAGKGILRWPLDNVHVTQYFGNTEFSRSGAYNGKGHNGVDFRASVGTPVKAALTGTVAGTGNTDAYGGCYSYGRWVLLRHPNGLATLYAHLSRVPVSQGQQVETGQVIGYSGNTGYSTGPHLHFTVYQASEVRIIRLGDVPGRPRTACSPAPMPVAPLPAYLNPMDYL